MCLYVLSVYTSILAEISSDLLLIYWGVLKLFYRSISQNSSTLLLFNYCSVVTLWTGLVININLQETSFPAGKTSININSRRIKSLTAHKLSICLLQMYCKWTAPERYHRHAMQLNIWGNTEATAHTRLKMHDVLHTVSIQPSQEHWHMCHKDFNKLRKTIDESL